jgi:hypothetical protein
VSGVFPVEFFWGPRPWALDSSGYSSAPVKMSTQAWALGLALLVVVDLGGWIA